MFTPPALLIAIIFLVLALALLQGVSHIAKLHRGRVFVLVSDPIKTNSQAKKDRDAAWDLFDQIQDQIPVLPEGEKQTETIIATYDTNVSDTVLVAALRLLKDAGWNATLSDPGRLALVSEKDGN